MGSVPATTRRHSVKRFTGHPTAKPYWHPSNKQARPYLYPFQAQPLSSYFSVGPVSATTRRHSSGAVPYPSTGHQRTFSLLHHCTEKKTTPIVPQVRINSKILPYPQPTQNAAESETRVERWRVGVAEWVALTQCSPPRCTKSREVQPTKKQWPCRKKERSCRKENMVSP